MKLTQVDTSDQSQSLKSHNSDSEILRLNDEPNQSKVVFTVGDETKIDLGEKLVRISTNNQDEVTSLDENVKQICSEITDYCSADIHEGLDIAKHLETVKVEDIDIAEYLESKIATGLECDEGSEATCAKVVDVIVIPSAEAILDTGQSVTQVDDTE